jgi:hypothetical protein
MDNKYYSNNKGFSKVVVILLISILSIAIFSYFTSKNKPLLKVQNPVDSQETNYNGVSREGTSNDLYIEGYSITIPIGFEVSRKEDDTNIYLYGTENEAVYFWVRMLNNEFISPYEYPLWNQLTNENPDFIWDSFQVKSYFAYQTNQEPSRLGNVTTYVILNNSQTMQVSMSSTGLTESKPRAYQQIDLFDKNSDHFREYNKLLNSIRYVDEQ